MNSDNHTHQRRHQRDGSISATGYFDGLDRNQARLSLDRLKEEYVKYLSNTEPDEESDIESEIGTPAAVQQIRHITQDSEDESSGTRKTAKEQMQFQQLQVFWSKRNWRTAFEYFQRYDGNTNLGLQNWNRLVNWIWLTLSEEHMSSLQGILERLRTSQSTMGHLGESQLTGRPRSQFQQELIRDYHKVVRSLNNQDISSIMQRFHLADLYRSHGAYVDQFSQSGLVPQTARQRVNRILLDVFNNELNIKVNLQTITNQLKEGRHWNELMHSRETYYFGSGMILLLPVLDYAVIVRKTADPIWSFLIQHLLDLSIRTINLAIALQPIAHGIHRKGIGKVDVPLLGYELRSATNLNDLGRTSYDACLATYLNISIRKAIRAIQVHGRKPNPDKIPAIVREETELKRKQAMATSQQKSNSDNQLVLGKKSQQPVAQENRFESTSEMIALEQVRISDADDPPTPCSRNNQPEKSYHAQVTGNKRSPKLQSGSNKAKKPRLSSDEIRRDQNLLDLSLMPPPQSSSTTNSVATLSHASISTIYLRNNQAVLPHEHSLNPQPCGRAPIRPPTTLSNLFHLPSPDWNMSTIISVINPSLTSRTPGDVATSTQIFGAQLLYSETETAESRLQQAQSSVTELSPSPDPGLSPEDERILADIPITAVSATAEDNSLRQDNIELETTSSTNIGNKFISPVEPRTEPPPTPHLTALPNPPDTNLEPLTTYQSIQALHTTVEVPSSPSPMTPLPESQLSCSTQTFVEPTLDLMTQPLLSSKSQKSPPENNISCCGRLDRN
ncbi:hypothetical protein HOY82DRAFT_617261 [Tuber indicum]|nr:hypothetical protein HOY82DRAFT_617261 [Tuber indicum]